MICFQNSLFIFNSRCYNEGEEGASDEVRALRWRQMRNMHVMLMVSQAGADTRPHFSST
jgi:hypothetical protein